MAVQYIILLSRQGKVRLAKWFLTLSLKEKSKIVKDVSTLVLGRRTKMCSFLEYKDSKVVYRRYASLFFIAGIESTDNELITLEIVHRYVEQMDRYYGNVCELDIIFNFQKAYYILDELLIAGELQESSKRDVLRRISQQDSLEEAEGDEEKFSRLMPYIGQLPGMSGDGSSSLGSGSGAGGMSSSGGPGGSFASARGRSGASRIGQSKSGRCFGVKAALIVRLLLILTISSSPRTSCFSSHRPLPGHTATIPDPKSQATSPTSAVDTVRASLLSRYSSATSLPGLASFSSVDDNPLLTTLRSLYLSPHTALAHTVQREDGTITYTPGANAYPPVRLLNPIEKQRILVTGGAGFVGSHLVDRLMLMGHNVICLDNFFTGSKSNVAHWIGHPNFELIRHDVVDPILVEVDQIYHLACPASPVHYQSNPVKTLKTGFFGTYNMLGLAKRVKARFLLSSTSEIYGDPEEHPQKESYWGHVNCTGPRACYDEGKRVAETLAYSYQRQEGVDVRVARIFNTFGPRMNWNDGRVVSNFILQALKSEDLTVYGDGKSTRSFQYVHDLVDGLMKLMNSNCDEPVNIGTQEEFTIDQFAQMVIDLVAEETGFCGSQVVHMAALEDDPQKRKPDTTRAKERLDWEPQWKVIDGLRETVKYFKTTQVGSEI